MNTVVYSLCFLGLQNLAADTFGQMAGTAVMNKLCAVVFWRAIMMQHQPCCESCRPQLCWRPMLHCFSQVFDEDKFMSDDKFGMHM